MGGMTGGNAGMAGNVPPPPDMSGMMPTNAAAAPSLNPSVIAPPPDLSGMGPDRGTMQAPTLTPRGASRGVQMGWKAQQAANVLNQTKPLTDALTGKQQGQDGKGQQQGPTPTQFGGSQMFYVAPPQDQLSAYGGYGMPINYPRNYGGY